VARVRHFRTSSIASASTINGGGLLLCNRGAGSALAVEQESGQSQAPHVFGGTITFVRYNADGRLVSCVAIELNELVNAMARPENATKKLVALVPPPKSSFTRTSRCGAVLNDRSFEPMCWMTRRWPAGTAGNWKRIVSSRYPPCRLG
jgi:hypothetical protein